LSFGERDGSVSARAKSIATAFSGVGFEARLSEAILHEMWEKWVLIAAMAGISCLMRATVGDVVASGSVDVTNALLDECAAVARAQGFAPRQSTMTRSRTMLTAPGSTLAASMLRDIERGASIEADHIVGDLIRRGAGEPGDYPLLELAYAHLKAYEARRTRERAVSHAA
jgi:2-dehydropantoate 2-reductase